jgi:hypothetical protein
VKRREIISNFADPDRSFILSSGSGWYLDGVPGPDHFEIRSAAAPDHHREAMRMFPRPLSPMLLLIALLSFACRHASGQSDQLATETSASTQAADLIPIGGYWFVTKSEPKVHYYKDGDRLFDLFSYHRRDSNKDGIENLRVSHDESFLIVQSQGYPNHPTAIFPNSSNPNSILVQDFTFRLPLRPQLADRITRLPMGPIGLALNGVVFFNPFEQGGMNAVEGYSEVWLDSCCGHPEVRGVYHYHKYPSCVKSPFVDDGRSHSPIIGFAFDGFPVYGPYESDGLMAKDIAAGGNQLDACNGHQDASRGYHYHATPNRFPYIIGGYAGVVETSNNRGLWRAGEGAIADNTQPGQRMPPGIQSVRPGTVRRGQTHQITFELTANEELRRPTPDGNAAWVQVGPFEAISSKREGNKVIAEIKILDDAPLGIWLDGHIEFETDFGPRVIKRNDVLRVVD